MSKKKKHYIYKGFKQVFLNKPKSRFNSKVKYFTKWKRNKLRSEHRQVLAYDAFTKLIITNSLQIDEANDSWLTVIRLKNVNCVVVIFITICVQQGN